MQGYSYKTGDRPLEGYTIQRGVGRGAFGEVYYALSDSGREVALKCIIGYEQIELRGVTQCMNLKNPHLVSIFDIRQNAQGQSFVIMEYVAGPSLRDLLNDSPSGLGTQKTAFFLRELAKGLSYLHDRGIVHRDLKPGNIFYEDGYVKIGDYGLSKTMTPSQHSGQTITVGTVHYMAPEIGKGCYDKGIDIYAMGVLVYEMLTGHVPFFGASHGEILMKHLVETPDVTGIEEPFATVIRKALAKDPADRYATVQEMVEAVFGAEHISQSVSVFQPDSLSVVAERAARKVVTVGGTGSSADLPASLGPDRPAPGTPSDVWVDFGQRLDRAVDRIGTAKDRILASRDRFRDRSRMRRDEAGDHDRDAVAAVESARAPGPAGASAAASDMMTQRQRFAVATVSAIILAIGTDVLVGDSPIPLFSVFVTLAVGGGVLGLMWSHTRLIEGLQAKGLARRLAYAGPAMLGCLVLSGTLALIATLVTGSSKFDLTSTYLAIFISLFALRWDKALAPNRRERVMLGHVLKAAVLGYIIAWMTSGSPLTVMGIVAGISLQAQICAPLPLCGSWIRRQVSRRAARAAGAARSAVASVPPVQRVTVAVSQGPDSAGSPTVTPQYGHPSRPDLLPGRPVPAGVKIVWFLLMLTGLGVATFAFIMAATVRSPDSEMFAAVGCTSLAAFLFCIRQVFRGAFLGWWTNLVRPLLTVVLLEVSIGSFTTMLATRHLSNNDASMFAFFTVFPAMLLIALTCITQRRINGLLGASTATLTAATPSPQGPGVAGSPTAGSQPRGPSVRVGSGSACRPA